MGKIPTKWSKNSTQDSTKRHTKKTRTQTQGVTMMRMNWRRIRKQDSTKETHEEEDPDTGFDQFYPNPGDNSHDLAPDEESAPDGSNGIQSKDDPSKRRKFKKSLGQRKNHHLQKIKLHLIPLIEIILADYQITFEYFIDWNSII
jgi:hypothetical protein